MGNINETIRTIQEHKDAAIFVGTLSFNAVLDIVGHNPTAGVIAFALSAAGLSMTTEKGAMIAKAMGIFSSHIPDEEKQVAFKEFIQEQADKIRMIDNKNHFSYEDDVQFSPFRLEEVVQKIRYWNERHKFYIGRLSDGSDLALSISEIYHLLYVAKSGRGKSNDFRFLMMQSVKFCETYYMNPFANDKKRLKEGDDRLYEIWKPIFCKLRNQHPVKDEHEMIKLMKHALNIIKKREGNEESEDQWNPVFIFIDELPECIQRTKDAGYKDQLITMIDRVARTGRQFWVFLCLASQTAAVKDIGLSEASQGQFSTLLYGGGVKRSGAKMLSGITEEQENMIREHKGLKMYLTEGQYAPDFVQTPLTTNEGLFDYLDVGTFNLNDWINAKQPTLKNSFSDFHSFENEQNDIFDEEEIENEQLETENTVEDDIMWAFEILRSKGVTKANKNQIVQLIKETWPDSIINYNTDGPKIVELAKEYGFEIIKGAGGRR